LKFEEFGNKLEKITITASPLTLAESNIFNMLMLLLKKVKDEIPDKLDVFININNNKLLSKVKSESTIKDSKKLKDEISKYDRLSDNYDLVKLHLIYMIETLGITEEQFWKNEQTAFLNENFMTALYVLFYLHQVVLIELLGRKKGTKFYREHVDNFNFVINARNQKDRHKDLESMRESDKEWLPRNPYGRFRLYNEAKGGRLIRICKNCEKFTGLQNTELINDKESFYNVLCYMHIPLVKVWNDNFILKQPSDEFLDEIWSRYK
jgi:hypothetical protein